MKSLNGAWLALIFIGLAALVFSVIFRAYQSFQGTNDEFLLAINPMNNAPLVPSYLEDHLTSSEDF